MCGDSSETANAVYDTTAISLPCVSGKALYFIPVIQIRMKYSMKIELLSI